MGYPDSMANDTCPHCDEPLSLGGKFCKACGWDSDLSSDEEASWMAGVDLPEELSEDDYERILDREGLKSSKGGIPAWWWLALALFLALAALVLNR